MVSIYLCSLDDTLNKSYLRNVGIVTFLYSVVNRTFV